MPGIAAEDLPDGYQRLEGSGGVGALSQIADLSQGLGHVEKVDGALVGDGGDFGEDRVLGTVGTEAPGQAVDRGRFERFGAIPVDIAEGHEDLQRLILDGLAREPEQGLQHVIRLLPIGG